jgi:hypothetical protein
VPVSFEGTIARETHFPGGSRLDGSVHGTALLFPGHVDTTIRQHDDVRHTHPLVRHVLDDVEDVAGGAQRRHEHTVRPSHPPSCFRTRFALREGETHASEFARSRECPGDHDALVRRDRHGGGVLARPSADPPSCPLSLSAPVVLEDHRVGVSTRWRTVGMRYGRQRVAPEMHDAGEAPRDVAGAIVAGSCRLHDDADPQWPASSGSLGVGGIAVSRRYRVGPETLATRA